MMQPRGSYRGNAPQSSIAFTEKPSIVPSAFTGTVTSRNVRSFPCVFAVCWSVRHRAVEVAPVERPRPHGVRAGVVVEHHLVRERLLAVEDERKRLVFDLDELGGVAGKVARPRDDGCDGIADVPHLADRERVVLD